MKICASKKMAQELNKAIQATRFSGMMTFEGVTMKPENYLIQVSNDYRDAETDFNYNTGRVKVINVIYGPEYYALNAYLTTRQLNRLYAAGDDWETYSNKVFEELEI